MVGYGQTITGSIIDSDDLPMIGVTIMEKGTNNGTISDINGNFELEGTTENPVLVLSFVGYQTMEIPYEGGAIDVMMNIDAAELDEVIVIGYGTQKKKVVTGAISKVDGERLEDLQIDRIENAMQGRTSGVRVTSGSGQPGDGADLMIRGTTGLAGNGGGVLYVVDGAIVGGGIDFLNPADILSIEVLKDAASSAIYGTRGSNGVVLITTKSGKAGETQVSYSGFYGVANLAKKVPVLNATEYATLLNESYAAAGLPVLFDDPLSMGVGTDWQDAVVRKDAPQYSHNIEITAGNDRSKIFGSFGLYNEQGIISDDNSNYRRINLRLNTDTKLTDWISVSTKAAYVRTNSQGVSTNSEWGSPLGRALNLDPITPIYETDPDQLATPIYVNNPVVTDENGVFGISSFVTSEILNPVAALSVGDGYGWSDKIVANGQLVVEPVKNLKFRSSIGADFAIWGGEGLTPVHYLNATNQVFVNSYNKNLNRGLTWIWDNTVSYDLNLNDHNFEFMVGTSATRNNGQSQGGTIRDVPFETLDDATLGVATIPENQSFGGGDWDSRVSSLVSRVTYNFKERYLFNFIMRRDGSTKFGSNFKYGYFPGVSFGWNLSDEPFFNVNAINYFKLRASWGLTGNDAIGDFLYTPQVNFGANYSFGLEDNLFIGAAPFGLSNPDLRWEETAQFNIGFDAVFLRNFKTTVDVYQKDVRNLLGTQEIPGFVGFGSPTANISSLYNQGIEVELSYENSINEFDFVISGNVSYTRNEVEKITNDVDFFPVDRYGPSGLEITRTEVGEPIRSFYGYQTAGIFQNQSEVDAYTNAEGELIQPDAAPGDIKFLDLNNDGILNEEDRTYLGLSFPPWTFGGTLDLFYKNFNLTVFGYGVAGNKVFKAFRRFDLINANFVGDALNRWTGEGTTNEYPRLVANDPNRNFSRSSDFFLEDGNFFRIKNIQLSYTLPETWTSKARIGMAKVYVGVNNAFLFTKYSGYDPEIPISIDRVIYPQPRTLVIGGNITFK